MSALLALPIALALAVPTAQAPPTAKESPFPDATPESQGMDAAALAAISSALRAYLERDFFVGAELLVIKNRRTVLHEYYGHADRDDGIEWGPGTVCNIRSMTKPLTGAAVQILADRGELSVDDLVAEYIEGFQNERSGEITIRQLLMHRAGMPLTILQGVDDYPDLVAMADAVGRRGPQFPPGERFWYSDSGTDVLGAIVEVVSGVSLDTFVREELLEPLGMGESFYYLDAEDPRRSRIASLYIGGLGKWTRFYDPDERPFYPYAWGSQSLYSTPLDYARFLAMWMDGGRVGERRLLSPEAIERTLTPASEMSMLGSDARFPTSFSGLEVHYGQMAVLHTPLVQEGAGPAEIIGHSGSDGTIAWAWPERDLMILCFTQSRGGGAVLRLEEVIDRHLLNPEAWAATAAAPEELQPYLGTYVADWASHMKEEFTVQCRNGELVLDIPSQLVHRLEKLEGEEKWALALSRDVTLWFERDEAGAVDCLRIRQGRLTFEAPRKGTPREARVAAANVPSEELVDHVSGVFHDPEADAEVEVLLDGDYLALRSLGRTFHLWNVPDTETWQVRQNPLVTITFQEDAGTVVSLVRRTAAGGTIVMERLE